MPARRTSEIGTDGPSPGEGRGRGKDGGKEKETFGCPYPGCGQSYSRMEYLKRHQRKHQDVRPFVCKDCAKSFARSDVLLRHRRRCHPTPPPADRSSRSPVPPHRNYPGVPVSSSRDDGEDAEPAFRGRKHARPSSSGEMDGQPAQRRRANDEPDEGEDDGRYGDSNRFRQNGMGNGGVYGSISDYYNNPTDPSYTPHLLPMFQQATPFAQPGGYHNQEESNHLEDASVLLSMAYGASSGQSATASQPVGQPQPAGAEDWASTQNLHMMMNASNGKNGTGHRNSTSSVETNGHVPQGVDVTQPSVINDVTGGFLPAMNWLGTNNKSGIVPSEGAGTWSSNASTLLSQPASPFNFNKLFSAASFPVTPVAADSEENNGYVLTEQETNQAVMRILNQMALHEVPQTKANPNPERPLLRLWHGEMLQRAGPEIEIDSRFHLPADRFAGCYQVPHWCVPPVRTLSLMANRTFDTILNHFSFLHTPTFKLTDTAACLAFAICTVGGVRAGRQQWDHLFNREGRPAKPKGLASLDGPVPPGSSWESTYERNYTAHKANNVDAKNVADWEHGHIVRSDKTNMLVKSFSQAQGVLMTEYNVALLQALILYHAPFFLSEEESERALANMFLGTIVSITRQIGFFSQELEHFQTTIQHPGDRYTPNELDLYWRRWIQLETRRRTAYLVYHLDMVSALESNIPCILSGCEISMLPLPAPDSLWKAPNAEEWFKAVKTYRPMTLDEAMRRMFYLPTYGSFDELHEKADTKYYNLLNTTELGPFARVAMVTTILRGIMDIGEGKRDRGDWRDLTDLWVSCTWLRPGKKLVDQEGKDLGEVNEGSLRDRFSHALQMWRQGWDFDPTCPNPVINASTASSASNASPGSTTSPGSNGSTEAAERKLNYCEEALPFYWLAQALLNILKQAPPHEPGWNAFAPGPGNNMQGVRYGEMLKSARMFTRMGEGFAGVNASTGSTPATNIPSVPHSAGAQSTAPTVDHSGVMGMGADPSAGPESINLDDISPESIFDGTTFEDFIGGFGNVDVLAT